MVQELKKTLSLWNLTHDFDALIWTDLKENFKTSEIEKPFSLEASIQYLDSLKGKALKDAADYILKAPPQTTTRHRKQLTDFITKKMQE